MSIINDYNIVSKHSTFIVTMVTQGDFVHCSLVQASHLYLPRGRGERSRTESAMGRRENFQTAPYDRQVNFKSSNGLKVKNAWEGRAKAQKKKKEKKKRKKRENF